MTIPELLAQFGPEGLTRDILRGWLEKGWLTAEISQGQGPKPRRVFSETEVDKIRTLLRCYGAGFNPESAHRIATQESVSLDLIGSAKLLHLMETLAELAGGVIFDDRNEFFSRVSEAGYRILDVECCSVFEVLAGQSLLRLGAQTNDKGLSHDSLELEIHNASGRGLTGWLAFLEHPARLHGTELRGHPGAAGRPASHLTSGNCKSLMMLPIRDRRRRVVGWLKAENRRGPGGARDATFFDRTDQWVGEQLIQPIPTALSRARLVQAPQKLLRDVLPGVSSLPEFLRAMVVEAMEITGAESGDVFWRDENKEMILVAVQPEKGSSIDLNQLLPRPSICHEALGTGRGQNIADVNDCGSYYAGRPQTRSQLAIPFFKPGNKADGPLGVLSVEAERTAAFDDVDMQAMQYLAEYAAPAASIMETRGAIPRRILEQMRLLPPGQGLSAILESVARDLGLDEGIIYVADRKYGLLRYAASRPARASALNFTFRFEAASFASLVFREQEGRFSADPWTDKLVSKDGLTLFEIEGPLVGVPLSFGSVAMGCMIVWSNKGRTPVPEDSIALRAYCDLAVTTIGIADATRRIGILDDHLTRAQVLIEGHADRGSVIRTILRGLALSFFDRVRLFVFDEKLEYALCVDSYGEEAPGKFGEEKIRIGDNPYASQLLSNLKSGLSKPYENNPSTQGSPGEDPAGAQFGKPKDLPWCLAGLIVKGLPIGYLAADSTRTKAAAGESGLEALAKAARVAAQVIALFRAAELPIA